MYSLNMNTTKHLHYFGHSYTRTHTYSHSLSTWPKSGTTTVQVIDAPKKRKQIVGSRIWVAVYTPTEVCKCMHAQLCLPESSK